MSKSAQQKPSNDLADLFSRIEATMVAKINEAGFIKHSGDKGENREHILREFLKTHLPKRYGVTKGEILTKEGQRSHAVDIIIYDALNCPVLYSEQTAIVPIEGVYGIIEVKSRLSKAEFQDAARKIESFKRLAPRELAVVRTREYVTVSRASRPFGVVLGYMLDGNSLESLKKNFGELNHEIHDVNYFTNLVVVLGEGLLWLEECNLSRGEKSMLLDTDKFVNLILTAKKKERVGEPSDEIVTRIVAESVGNSTFGKFFVYLLVMLLGMKVNTPDIARYIDPNLGPTIMRES
jgi:hypothetical protein